MIPCPECGILFEPAKKTQIWHSDACRYAHHNREKKKGVVRLTPELLGELETYAVAHDVSINEIVCKMLHKCMNPQGRPLDYEAAWGGKLVD